MLTACEHCGGEMDDSEAQKCEYCGQDGLGNCCIGRLDHDCVDDDDADKPKQEKR